MSTPVTGETFADELRDAIAPRTVALVVGVLLLQLGFVLSYVGAFHQPTPHEIPIAVVAPAAVSSQTVSSLNGIASRPLDATAVGDEASARRRLERDQTSAVLVVDPASTQDTLLVTTGGGASVATATQAVITQVEATQKRTVAVKDVVPSLAGDARGLSGFYLITGWIVGGYLLAALLGIAKGARPATFRRSLLRLGATVPYAVLSGLGGAVIVGPVLGALPGHLLALWGVGVLVVMAAATVTMAFQSLVGVLGIGLTVLVFVVLGNPSAGGAYQGPLLPPFWRAIGPVLPNGAGTDAVRRIVYFGAEGAGVRLAVVAAWVVAGVAVTLLAGRRHHRSRLGPATTAGRAVEATESPADTHAA